MSPAAVIPQPRLFCLYEVDPAVIECASRIFDFVTPEDVKRRGPQLKYVGKYDVGVDAIAVKELQDQGVVVMNTPGVNVSQRRAELTLTLALCTAHHMPQIDRRIRSGDTVTKADGGSTGFQLTGCTLGLVGGGNIGYQLGRMFAGAFGAKVIVSRQCVRDLQGERPNVSKA
ncbi:hypothetical protein Q5752_006811 [Cryptotrichosporon argae]